MSLHTNVRLVNYYNSIFHLYQSLTFPILHGIVGVLLTFPEELQKSLIFSIFLYYYQYSSNNTILYHYTIK